MVSKSTQEIAAHAPVARVLPLLGLAHLDRGFDYLVTEQDSEAALPGVRVRVMFGGRRVDAVVLERRDRSEHDGRLKFIDRVISPVVVYPQRMRRLIDSLADRYAGTRSDLIRSAIPPRHAGAESADVDTPWEELGQVEEPDLAQWSAYTYGESFVDAVIDGVPARAAWHIAPGEDWAQALMALAVKVALEGRGCLVVVPDQRDVDKLEAAARTMVSARQITTLSAGLGHQARYRRYLSILSGQARIVVGTRSAAFAPVKDLGLAVILHDGDDNLVDPRAPYVHSREVLTTRAALESCSLILAGYSRTAETQVLVEGGWAHSLSLPQSALRTRMPHIRAAGDSDFELMRDPRARSARLPLVAFEALRSGLERGRPVLVQTPRKGYVPTLACGNCREPSRCRTCNGPLGIPDGDGPGIPTCRWCGRPDSNHRCGECGSGALRAVVLGAGRTAQELGKAFPLTTVVTSGGAKVVDEIDDRPSLVVATPGAEPHIKGGGRYGAAVLLDTWALLGRQDLRATEDALAKWTSVASQVEPRRHGGTVVVVAEPSAAVVQEFIRLDVESAAARELRERRAVGFPPAVYMAAIDGAEASLALLMDLADLPEGADVLGPVDLPAGVTLPGEYDAARFGPPQRMLVRAPLAQRVSLGRALRIAQVARATRKDDLPLRVMVDPINVG